jgi:hypothetical protein
MSRALISAAVGDCVRDLREGPSRPSRRMAAQPATSGVAMLVPLLKDHPGSAGWGFEGGFRTLPEHAERIHVPGATTSGLQRPPLTGPRLLESATCLVFESSGSLELRLEPTVMQFLAAAGPPICPAKSGGYNLLVPLFPAEKHMTMSCCLLTNSSIFAALVLYSTYSNRIGLPWEQGSQQAKTIWARPSARLVLVPLILSRLDQDRPRQAAKILIRSCLFRRLLDDRAPCPEATPKP